MSTQIVTEFDSTIDAASAAVRYMGSLPYHWLYHP